MTVVPSLAWTIVLALAAYRATRLIASDSITAPARAWLYDWAWIDPATEEYAALPTDRKRDDGKKLVPVKRAGGLRTWVYELLTCPHCLGVWMAALAYVVWRWGGDVLLAVLAILAVAGLQSIIVSALPDDSVDET